VKSASLYIVTSTGIYLTDLPELVYKVIIIVITTNFMATQVLKQNFRVAVLINYLIADIQ